jgi:hypothetical protein
MASNNINRVEQSRRSKKLSPVSTSDLVKFAGLLFAVGTSTGLTTLTATGWTVTADALLVRFATAIPAVGFSMLTIAFYLIMVMSLIKVGNRVVADRLNF